MDEVKANYVSEGIASTTAEYARQHNLADQVQRRLFQALGEIVDNIIHQELHPLVPGRYSLEAALIEVERLTAKAVALQNQVNEREAQLKEQGEVLGHVSRQRDKFREELADAQARIGRLYERLRVVREAVKDGG